jgi:hypothetical protein
LIAPPALYHRWTFRFIGLLLAAFFLCSCSSEPTTVKKNDESAKLAGTWLMKSRIVADKPEPADQRIMKLHFGESGTFRAEYRGNTSQSWITAGRGAFSYEPPYVTLFWDTGQVLTLMVREAEGDRLTVHHGKTLAPLANQEPDEEFERIKETKGPTRKPS